MESFNKAYEEALETARKLYAGKGIAYNRDGKHIKDYWIHGEQDLIYELNKKVIRLEGQMKALREKKESVQTYYDSPVDSCIDLINYAAFLYAYIITEVKL